MSHWHYELSEEEVAREIAAYRATLAGQANTPTDTELSPYAVNTLVARHGEKLGNPNQPMYQD